MTSAATADLSPSSSSRSSSEPSPFHIDKFIARSRQLDLTGIPLEDAAKYPVSPSEIRTIRFMQDTELFTVLYMKALLETRALQDPEARAFLVIWGYEECSHGRALARFLELVGHEPSRKSDEQFSKPRKWLELLQDAGGRAASFFFHDFLATHMTWGAINELTAVHAYNRMAALTANPVLAEIVRRIAKDERRHFAFYYQQARRRLTPRLAQHIAKFALTRLWAPVGVSMSSQEDGDFPTAYLFDGDAGQTCLRDVDDTIRKLPGMQWFNLVEPALTASIHRIRDAGVPMNRPIPIAAR